MKNKAKAAVESTVDSVVGRRLHAERCSKIARREADRFRKTNTELCAAFSKSADQYDAQASNSDLGR